MLKKMVAAAAMLFAVASWAAVDANKATEAELDGLKGVGPTMSKRIIDARKQAQFKDWHDLMDRVKGMKEKSATKLSAEGLTVNGKPFDPTTLSPTAAKPEPKKAESPAAKAPAKP